MERWLMKFRVHRQSLKGHVIVEVPDNTPKTMIKSIAVRKAASRYGIGTLSIHVTNLFKRKRRRRLRKR